MPRNPCVTPSGTRVKEDRFAQRRPPAEAILAWHHSLDQRWAFSAFIYVRQSLRAQLARHATRAQDNDGSGRSNEGKAITRKVHSQNPPAYRLKSVCEEQMCATTGQNRPRRPIASHLREPASRGKPTVDAGQSIGCRSAEDALEDRVDVLGVVAHVEEGFEIRIRQRLLHVGVGLQKFEEVAFAAPDRHGVALDEAVGILA